MDFYSKNLSSIALNIIFTKSLETETYLFKQNVNYNNLITITMLLKNKNEYLSKSFLLLLLIFDIPVGEVEQPTYRRSGSAYGREDFL